VCKSGVCNCSPIDIIFNYNGSPIDICNVVHGSPVLPPVFVDVFCFVFFFFDQAASDAKVVVGNEVLVKCPTKIAR